MMYHVLLMTFGVFFFLMTWAANTEFFSYHTMFLTVAALMLTLNPPSSCDGSTILMLLPRN